MHNRDADPVNSQAADTAAALKDAGANLFTVCVNCADDVTLPAAIASDSGGGAITVSTAAALATIATAAGVAHAVCTNPGFEVNYEARSTALAKEADLLRNLLASVVSPEPGQVHQVAELTAANMAGLVDSKAASDAAVAENCNNNNVGGGDDDGAQDREIAEAKVDTVSYGDGGGDGDGADDGDVGGDDGIVERGQTDVVDQTKKGKGKGPKKAKSVLKKEKGGKKHHKKGWKLQPLNKDAALASGSAGGGGSFAGHEFVALLVGVCVSVFVGTVVANVRSRSASGQELGQ